MMNGITPWLQRHWDERAAGNFICGGTGTGFLLTAAITAAFGGRQDNIVDIFNSVQVFTLIGLALIGLGLFSVFLELGRPFRSINVLLNAKTSWMTREAIVAMPLFVSGLLAVAFGSWLLLVIAAVVGMGFLYCQGRILIASKGIPAWRNPAIMALILSTGIAEGAGFYLVMSWLIAPDLAQTASIVPVTILLIGIAARIITWRRYRRALSGGNAPDAALAVLDKSEATVTAVGHAIPVVLIFVALVMPDATFWLSMAGGLCAAVGGWFLKFVIITRAAFNQGFAIEHSPARGSGPTGPGIKPGWNGH